MEEGREGHVWSEDKCCVIQTIFAAQHQLKDKYRALYVDLVKHGMGLVTFIQTTTNFAAGMRGDDTLEHVWHEDPPPYRWHVECRSNIGDSQRFGSVSASRRPSERVWIRRVDGT